MLDIHGDAQKLCELMNLGKLGLRHRQIETVQNLKPTIMLNLSNKERNVFYLRAQIKRKSCNNGYVRFPHLTQCLSNPVLNIRQYDGVLKHKKMSNENRLKREGLGTNGNIQGQNSQDFLSQICKIFVTSRCRYEAIIQRM